jgi:hypothetical protein
VTDHKNIDKFIQECKLKSSRVPRGKMLEFIKKLFKTAEPKLLRVCNNCAFKWYPKEESPRKSGYGRGLMFCPNCGNLDTQVENDWHRANAYKLRRWREDYLKNHAESEQRT